MVAACPFPWPRGTPVRIYRMAEALAGRGHDVQIATYHIGEKLMPLPCAVHRIRDVPGYTNCEPGPHLRKLLQLDPLLAMTLRRLLRSQSFDVIHAHHYEGLLTALAATARKRRLPVIFDAHTLLASELPYYPMGLPRGAKERIGSFLDTQLPRRADHVIAVSESIRSALIAKGRVDERRISVIPNGVETEHFAAFDLSPPPTRQGRRAAFAGNLAAYQGVDLLLQAFSIVHRQLDDVRLMILTDSDFAKYLPMAESLGIDGSIDVHNPGYLSLPSYLHGADILLNPRPVCDGIPQKLLNYMAAGRPIVSFADSGKIIEHERTGLLAADGDVQSFAAAMLRLFSQPEFAARLGANAQALATTEYGWARVAANVEAVYEGVLADNRRHGNE
jgi:glycosyltransferase involved in cell wall biosynthesis